MAVATGKVRRDSVKNVRSVDEITPSRQMTIETKRYFKPSKEARVLSVLDSLSRDSSVTQQELGRRMNISGAMVNQYLREIQDSGYVEFRPLNGKSFRYMLTGSGDRKRQEMFSEYASETVQVYTDFKNLLLGKLSTLEERGIERIVLFGASETCEVLLSALYGTTFAVVALLDSDAAKHGRLFHGHVISPPEILPHINCEAVVISSFGRQEEIHQQIQDICQSRNLEIVRL